MLVYYANSITIKKGLVATCGRQESWPWSHQNGRAGPALCLGSILEMTLLEGGVRAREMTLPFPHMPHGGMCEGKMSPLAT